LHTGIEVPSAVLAARFGPAYLPAEPRRATSRAKNSQEAHEAIRPADVAITPQQLPAVLDSDQVKLYTLIWQRTVAYQMSSATFKQVGLGGWGQDA
jgi:DNA topoisomerase-1